MPSFHIWAKAVGDHFDDTGGPPLDIDRGFTVVSIYSIINEYRFSPDVYTRGTSLAVYWSALYYLLLPWGWTVAQRPFSQPQKFIWFRVEEKLKDEIAQPVKVSWPELNVTFNFCVRVCVCIDGKRKEYINFKSSEEARLYLTRILTQYFKEVQYFCHKLVINKAENSLY